MSSSDWLRFEQMQTKIVHLVQRTTTWSVQTLSWLWTKALTFVDWPKPPEPQLSWTNVLVQKRRRSRSDENAKQSIFEYIVGISDWIVEEYEAFDRNARIAFFRDGSEDRFQEEFERRVVTWLTGHACTMWSLVVQFDKRRSHGLFDSAIERVASVCSVVI